MSAEKIVVIRHLDQHEVDEIEKFIESRASLNDGFEYACMMELNNPFDDCEVVLKEYKV